MTLEFKEAFKLFRSGSYDEANELSLWLLQQPALGNYHKAGAHLILAHSPDEYVAHASEAVKLYESLYEGRDPPTKKQKKSQDTLIAAAKKVLRKALNDAMEFGGGEGKLDMEELQEDIDANLQEFARLQDEEEARAEAGEEGESMDISEDTGEASAKEIDINSLPLATLADDSYPTPPVSRENPL